MSKPEKINQDKRQQWWCARHNGSHNGETLRQYWFDTAFLDAFDRAAADAEVTRETLMIALMSDFISKNGKEESNGI